MGMYPEHLAEVIQEDIQNQGFYLKGDDFMNVREARKILKETYFQSETKEEYDSIMGTINATIDYLIEESKPKDKIFIYPFRSAPQELKDLSTHGGDEDYIIVTDKDNIEDWGLELLLNKVTISDYCKAKTTIDDEEFFVYITAHA